MAEHVWEIGDWAEFKGVRYLVYKCDPDDTYFVTENGCSWCPIQCAVEHLPDCTGWTWQPAPKLQLREGAWYERADGEVVGPCIVRTLLSDISAPPWSVSGCHYTSEGKHFYRQNGFDIIREVPAPAPKYRPFANAAEFKPHRDRWIRDKNNWAVRVNSLSHDGANGSSWHSLVNHWTFEDTGLPVGVEVQS